MKHHCLFLLVLTSFVAGFTPMWSNGQPILKPRVRILPISITSIQPANFVAGQPVTVFFTVTNNTLNSVSGDVIPQIEGVSINPAQVHISRLLPATVFTGSLMIQSPPVCYQYELELDFNKIDSLSYRTISKTTKKPITVWIVNVNEQSSDVTSLTFASVINDRDFDGMDDGMEQHLLEKFRPMMRYSLDEGPEQYAPTDPFRYIMGAVIGGKYQSPFGFTDHCPAISGFDQSQLATNPAALLNVNDAVLKSSDVLQNATKPDYHLVPNDAGEKGGPWPTNIQGTNVGLFGHVVPIILSSSIAYDRGRQFPCTGNAGDRLFYKVEYWQFYGYNYAHHHDGRDYGDHQGDWCTVQLVIDPVTENIVTALYYAHGSQMRFDVLPGMVPVTLWENGVQYKQFNGANAIMQPSTDIADDGGQPNLKDNTWLKLAADPLTGDFTHPLVFIENGSHEFWPSEFGRFGKTELGLRFYSPLHNGDDFQHSYLAMTPPNLGEVGHTMMNTPEANVIMRYNGFWGCYNVGDNPPPGPAMHFEWTYPYNSSLFTTLQGVLEY